MVCMNGFGAYCPCFICIHIVCCICMYVATYAFTKCVLSVNVLCVLLCVLRTFTRCASFASPPPSPSSLVRVTRFRHQVSVLRDQSAGQREFGFNNGGTLSIRVRRTHLLQDGLDLLKNVRPRWTVTGCFRADEGRGMCVHVFVWRSGTCSVTVVWCVMSRCVTHCVVVT